MIPRDLLARIEGLLVSRASGDAQLRERAIAQGILRRGAGGALELVPGSIEGWLRDVVRDVVADVEAEHIRKKNE